MCTLASSLRVLAQSTIAPFCARLVTRQFTNLSTFVQISFCVINRFGLLMPIACAGHPRRQGDKADETNLACILVEYPGFADNTRPSEDRLLRNALVVYDHVVDNFVWPKSTFW
jgi:hypothetical protein